MSISKTLRIGVDKNTGFDIELFNKSIFVPSNYFFERHNFAIGKQELKTTDGFLKQLFKNTDSQRKSFKDSITTYIKRNKKFIVPIFSLHFDFQNNKSESKHYKKSTIKLSDELILALKKNLATLVVIQPAEGFKLSEGQIDVLYQCSQKYNLSPENFYYIDNNFLVETAIDNFRAKMGVKQFISTKTYPYFRYNPWFTDLKDTVGHNNNLNFLLKYENNRSSFSKKFLSLNRRSRDIRIQLFIYLFMNKAIRNNSYLSCGFYLPSEQPESVIETYRKPEGENFILLGIKYKLEQFKDYLYNKIDFSRNFVLDVDLNINQANKLPTQLHLDSFMSIVGETLVEKNELFLSEKIFKPIYTFQPFVVLGNMHTLKVLRDMGFKTFDKWWDESYDEIPNQHRRLEAIVKLVEKINEWDYKKLLTTKKEMLEVLEHNYKVFISMQDKYCLYDYFCNVDEKI